MTDNLDQIEPESLVGDNQPILSVSEISQNLKRTVEDNFSHVRVRGEISRLTLARSGHMYLTLKDENAVLDGVCWRGTVSRLAVSPEDGMEVIVTGRLSTYAGRSSYQIVIEQMEVAGEGALLKMRSFLIFWFVFLQLAIVVPQLWPIPQSSTSPVDCSFSNTSKRFFTLVVGMKSAKVAALGMGRPCLGATVCHSTAPMKVGALAGQVTAFTGRVAPAPPSLQCRDMCPGLPQR